MNHMNLNIEQIESYHNSGCNIYPALDETLYIINYWEASRSLPAAGNFGSMACFDGLEAAKELANSTFGQNWFIKLELPDLVFTVVHRQSLESQYPRISKAVQ